LLGKLESDLLNDSVQQIAAAHALHDQMEALYRPHIDFAALEADSYQFGLTADGQDLSQAPLVLTGKEIMAGKSRTIVMEGWTGPMRTSVSGVQAASLVVTVSAMEEMEEGDLSAGIIAGRVPEGGTYTAADGTVYNAGDRMPLVPADGDMLTYEEYSYQYNAWYKGASFGLNPEINGWNARVIDRMKTSYGPIARSIQGIDICSIEYCYAGCYKATAFPSVPAWVTRMSYAFDGCTTFTGTIVVDANPTVYKNAFMNTTKPIVITGACSDELKAALAATGNWENITWE